MRTLPLLLLFFSLAACKCVDPAKAQASAAHENDAHMLGLTLVNPSDTLMAKHQLSKQYPGPIIVSVENSTSFAEGQAPYVGCSIWVVEAVAYGMIPTEEARQKGLPSRFPRTVKEMAAALVDCSSSPADAEKLWADSRERDRQAAKTAPDATEKARLSKLANQAMPANQRGKYTCRIVYNYPAGKGTMTTYVQFSESDMKSIRALSKK
jgi:hypothetical protein